MEASRAAPPRGEKGKLRRLAPLRRKRLEPAAFEELYREHAPDVYRYALALLANPADAEDVTQTTFLNAYRAFERGERPRRPHNWLIAIAHNVCRMRWRQARARPREVALEEAPEAVAPGPEPGRPGLDEVLRALARLSFNQRAALVMRELEGRSYAEIAEVLGLSVSAVEALLFRARRALRLRRTGLGVLTTAPLPGSLGSFVGGGGAAAGGGAALGAQAALKAAAVVAAGAVTAGAGYRTVEAVVAPGRSNPQAQAHEQQRQWQENQQALGIRERAAVKTASPARADQKQQTARGQVQATRPGGQAEDPTPAPTTSEAQPAAGGQTAVAPPPPPTSTRAVTSTVAAVSPVPLPPPPTVPLPPPPPLPVTVTTPTIPPPPKLP